MRNLMTREKANNKFIVGIKSEARQRGGSRKGQKPQTADATTASNTR